MDFTLSHDQAILRQAVRKFAEEVIRPVMKELDEKETFSVDLTRQMFDLGLFGITVDPDYSGYGMDYLSYCVAVEELARVDGCQAATVAAGNSLGIGPIQYFGSEEQKKRYLPKLCSTHLWGFGLTEPDAGSDAGGTRTTAVRNGNEWVINGSKIFITNAANPLTLGITVQAITGKRDDGHKEYTCFLVESDARGLTAREMHRKLCWRSSNTAELFFEDVRVADSAILGKRGEGFHQMLATLDRGRLAIAAMGLGGAQGAFETALAYAKQRKQFGKIIAEFQSNSFKLADMETEIEAARSLLYRACWLKDTDQPFGRMAAMAKLYCSEVMHRVADHGVQLHGGYGLMEEYDAAKFYRDQRLLEIGEGTSEIQRMVIARSLLR